MLKSLKINTSNEKWNEPLRPLQLKTDDYVGFFVFVNCFFSNKVKKTRFCSIKSVKSAFNRYFSKAIFYVFEKKFCCLIT